MCRAVTWLKTCCFLTQNSSPKLNLLKLRTHFHISSDTPVTTSYFERRSSTTEFHCLNCSHDFLKYKYSLLWRIIFLPISTENKKYHVDSVPYLFYFAFCTSTKFNLLSVSRSCYQWVSRLPSINISPSKSHIHVPYHRSLQMINSIFRPCVISVNMLVFYWDELVALFLLSIWLRLFDGYA